MSEQRQLVSHDEGARILNEASEWLRQSKNMWHSTNPTAVLAEYIANQRGFTLYPQREVK